MKIIPAEIYSRVSGYFRPVNQWNKGKREEFSDREYLVINKDKIKESGDEIKRNNSWETERRAG
jgi:hypothetical protein